MDHREAEGRVAVITSDDESTLTDCLDHLAAQKDAGVELVVVDRGSADRSTDVAIRHPAVDAVFPVHRRASVVSMLESATRFSRTTRLLVVPAMYRPGPTWVAAGLGGLETHDVVLDDHHANVFAVHVPTFRDMDAFGGGDPEEIARRMRRAGRPLLRGPAGFTVHPAHDAPPMVGGLPAQEPPDRELPRMSGLVSVVVCTRGREAELPRLLDTLRALDDDDHEVIVVDNNDEPTVAQLPAAGSVRLVHEPRKGLDVARNRGLAEAAGAVIAYVDDDCEVDPYWLSHLRVAFADPTVDMVTGRVRAASLREPAERHFEVHFGFDRGTRPTRYTVDNRRRWYPLWGGMLGTGCNMAFRTETLRSIGGFDELLDMGTAIGGGGDLDVYVRLFDAGATAAYAPEALVWHHHRSQIAALGRQFLGYGTSIGALLTKALIERPAVRREATRFWFQRLKVSLGLIRAGRDGRYPVPAGVVARDLWGQLRGPWVYLAARLAQQRSTS